MSGKISFCKYSENADISLYKYFGNLQYAKDAIINRRIHLEVPSDYNDIYDSAMRISENSLSTVRIRAKWLTGCLKATVDPQYHNVIDEYMNVSNTEWIIVEDFVQYLCNKVEVVNKTKFVDDIIQVTMGHRIVQANNNKISCFSERNDSILMWAYYAKNYSGVCLGFDLKRDVTLRSNCHKVSYSRYLTDSARSYNNYFRKSDEWIHEQEWRVVCSTDESYLPTTALSSVILGPKIEEDEHNIFVDLCRQYCLDIYTIVPSPKEFKLEVVPL